MDENKFLLDIRDYISKSINFDKKQKNSMNCDNCFCFNDNYTEEKEILSQIKSGNFQNTTEQGNLLENLLKNLFNRFELISSFSVTNRDTALGQIDINLTPIDETIYDIWKMIGDYPYCLIGECKNKLKSKPVEREEIEKMCWRTSKAQALNFFIGSSYTQPAIKEIGEFHSCKESILKKSEGVYIIPITISMLDIFISNNLNFCYFIRWAIETTKRKMAIANYLR